MFWLSFTGNDRLVAKASAAPRVPSFDDQLARNSGFRLLQLQVSWSNQTASESGLSYGDVERLTSSWRPFLVAVYRKFRELRRGCRSNQL